MDIQLKNKKDIASLSKWEKIKLLRLLVNENANCFNLSVDILPHDKEEYCGCLRELIRAIGIKKKPVSSETFEKMRESFNRLCVDSHILKTSDNFVLDSIYYVKDFVRDVLAVCKDLTVSQRNAVTSYFGFEIKNTNEWIIEGFPAFEEDNEELEELSSPSLRIAVTSVRQLVQKFVYENKIICKSNKPLENELNIICKTFPEFLTLIGRVQHGVHDYTLDSHILMVLKHVLNQQAFNHLSGENKRILLIAVFLHDLTKAENKIDKTHPAQSAYVVDMILDKTPIGEEQKRKIFTLIKNHDFLEKYNRKWCTVADIAQAFENRDLFEMCCILTIADLKSVKADLSFYERNYPVLLKAKSEILPLFE